MSIVSKAKKDRYTPRNYKEKKKLKALLDYKACSKCLACRFSVANARDKVLEICPDIRPDVIKTLSNIRVTNKEEIVIKKVGGLK